MSVVTIALLLGVAAPTVASGQTPSAEVAQAVGQHTDGSHCQTVGCTTCGGPVKATVGSGPVRKSVASNPVRATVASQPVRASVASQPVRASVASQPVRAAAGDDEFRQSYLPAVAPGGCGECGGCATGAGPCMMAASGGRRGIGMWSSFQFMHAWTKERNTTPLATTSPTGTPIGEAGDLPGATILFGGGYGGERQSGGLLDLGLWMDPGQSLGFGFRGFALEGDKTGFHASSDGTGVPILARPYFDVLTGMEDSILTSFPGLFDGDLRISTANEVYSAEPYLRLMVARGRFFEFDVTAGYHFSRINDGIVINSNTTIIDPQSPLLGGVFDVTDAFSTRNEFHGGSLGFRSKISEGRVTMRTLGKVSFGNMHQRASISGETIATAFGITDVQPYGMLALPSNIGNYSQDVSCWTPEASISLGYRLTRAIELSVGYHLIYWSNFAAAADQIDRNLNLSQIPDPNMIVGDPLPQFTFNSTDFWVQSVTLGLNIEF